MIPLDNQNALIEIMKMSFIGAFFGGDVQSKAS